MMNVKDIILFAVMLGGMLFRWLESVGPAVQSLAAILAGIAACSSILLNVYRFFKDLKK